MIVEERPGMTLKKLTFAENAQPGRDMLPITIF